MATGNVNCVVVAVDGSEESMNALRWALQKLRVRPKAEESDPGSFVVPHAQSLPTIAAGLNPGSIPFVGPSHVEVPAFTAAMEAHQRRTTEVIMVHACRSARRRIGGEFESRFVGNGLSCLWSDQEDVLGEL